MKEKCPICGMDGKIEAHGHYFCSQGCILKYEKENNISSEKCISCAVKVGTWYRERVFIVAMIAIILLALGYFLPLLKPFSFAFIDYLRMIWWAILAGFLIGGIIDFFVPRQYIEKYLSRHRKRTIIYSIFFGFIMTACSHGILAISMELYKKGASTPAVIAFLLASPWANLPITILLFGFFGLKAIFIVLSALVIAITTGLIYQVLERKGLVECNKCEMGEDIPVLTDFSIIDDIKRRWRECQFSPRSVIEAVKGVLIGSWSLTKMVLWWLLIGMIIAAFARAYVPQRFFTNFMGPTFIGLMVTLLFATIIEVCSEGSSPLAFEIFRQTGAFGNSFVFLMAGVATDYTEIGLIWSNIGKRAALWLPVITVPQILVLAYIYNNIW
ncbi:permease [candidate division WOR-3 bacterium]|nr:permease [candidate division WOR-3 bacterium]